MGVRRRTVKLAPLVVVIVTVLLVFGQVGAFDFTNFDDPEYVIDTPEVAGGISARSALWTLSAKVGNLWHPLTLLSHQLDVQIFGSWAGGHHLTNLGFHLGSASLVLFLFRGWYPARPGVALLLALVWAVHPSRAESVAWVSQRKDVLATFFVLLTLYLHQRGLARPERRRPLLGFVSAILALLSKPTAVVLAPLLMLLDWWPGRKISDISQFRARVTEKWPLLLGVGLLAVWTATVQMQGGHRAFTETVPLLHRVSNIPVAYGYYLFRTVVPYPSSVFIDYPQRTQPVFLAASLLALGLLSALAWHSRKRNPAVLLGWLWFLSTLLPVCGILPPGAYLVADRYLYLSQIGLLLMVGALLARLLPPFRTAAQFLGFSLVPVLAGLCFLQTSHWKDSRTLFGAELRRNPSHSLALVNFGMTHYDEGDLEEAEKWFVRAAEARPEGYLGNLNLGNVLRLTGRLEEAVSFYRKAIDGQVINLEAHQNLAALLAEAGRWDDALEIYERAREIEPENPEVLADLGAVYLMKEDIAAAILSLEAAIEAEPTYSPALRRLALIRRKQGRAGEAEALEARASSDG